MSLTIPLGDAVLLTVGWVIAIALIANGYFVEFIPQKGGFVLAVLLGFISLLLAMSISGRWI